MSIETAQKTPTLSTGIDLSRMRMFFDECFVGDEDWPTKDPALSLVIDRATEELKKMFGVDDLSIIERAWLRHITVSTIREYNRQQALVTAKELDPMYAIPIPPFSEITARWVCELYRSDFLSSGEVRNWAIGSGVSERFKTELRLQRALAHRL